VAIIRKLSAALLALAFVGPALAGTGDLDPTFGTGGSTVTPLGFGFPGAAVLRQSTGKIVVAGSTGTSGTPADDMAVVRYDAAGSVDSTFGTGGVATVDFSPRFTGVQGAALQVDDAIVVVGIGSDVANALVNPALLVARLDADGGLDPTFGTGGRVVVANLGLEMRDVALLPDGRILLAGSQNLRFAAVRLEADGDPDPTFGTGGIASTTVCCGAAAVALLPTGESLLAGTTQDDALVMRLDADGAPDAGFGVGGTVALEFAAGDRAAASAITALGDGRIVVAGSGFFTGGAYFVSHHGVARLTAGGALDPTFGTGGTVAVPTGFQGVFEVPSSTGGAVALVVEPSGRLLVLGVAAFGPPFAPQLELLRFEPDGALDRTFGYGGRTFTRLLDVTFPGAILLQPDGRPVVAGSAATAGSAFGDLRWLVARYHAACPALPDGDGDGTGDACDPCTGGPAGEHATLKLTKILPPAGDDRMRLSIRGQLPPGAPIDPLADGLRFAVEDATGATLLDTTIPPGSLDTSIDVGWATTGTRFRYRNRRAIVPRVEGVDGATLRLSADGEVRLKIKGKNGSYAFDGAPLPLQLRVVLSPPRGDTGLCFEVDFADGDGCTPRPGRLACRS
jgi:uncharacterized delta-60 repeat protein